MIESGISARGDGLRILVAHGAGSTAATARGLLEPLFRDAWQGPMSWTELDDRTGDVRRVVAAIVEWLDDEQAAELPRVVSGISLGAHASMLALAHHQRRGGLPPDGCLVALPAWTGPPDATAEVTAQTGHLIGEQGVPATLADIRQRTTEESHWLLPALVRDWASYAPAQLARALVTASQGCGPSLEDLHSIRVPTAVIGASDDPLHPETVSRAWAAALRDSSHAHVSIHAARGLLDQATRTAVRAWADRIRSARSTDPGGYVD